MDDLAEAGAPAARRAGPAAVGPAGPAAAPRASPAALVFLRGRDADARLRALAAGRSALRPVLGALATAFLGRRLYHAIGYRCLGDWSREKLGLGDRTVREWARVSRALAALPGLRAAVESGEVPWSVARKVVGLAAPANEAAVLESVRGRTLRAVEAMVRAVREADGRSPQDPATEEPEAEGDRVTVRIPAAARVMGMWHAACELARRKAGEELPTWACAEAIAAEGATVFGAGDGEGRMQGRRPRSEPPASEVSEDGRREFVWPRLAWKPLRGGVPRELAALSEGLDDPSLSPLEIARRLEAAVAFRQQLDLELGRILRQIADRRLYRELGFESFAHYVEERMDLAARTARRLVRLARAEHTAPAVATAFRSGELTAMQAEALLRVATPESAPSWVARARRVTLRRLEDEADAVPAAAIAFCAPREVAELFLDVLARAGSLEALLAHAIETWVQEGEHWNDHPTVARDGYRCTAPACRARKGLEGHHVWPKGRGGPRRPLWNQTTLCWFHHHVGAHGGRLRVAGLAPDRLVFELAGERYRSGDVRVH